MGGRPTLTPVDRRANVIGRLCAALCLASAVIAAILLLLMAGEVVAARTWPYAVLLGAALAAWAVALLTMQWHQARVGLPTQDSDDWDRRSDAGRMFGFLVPFAYLLGTPEQRRVARYARRTRRRSR
jgi:hypothetical protein